ncbi:MAG: CDP-diacylglycerol--glycerol-3-phosphate 3-phosphatidyltransferase [Candidatus Cloacimonetes bacterium]|nr:CDP-diacylglycerol--glycerol-3-phosphate 3-phosphatidyltransferase [Candidatus Cloacimonadota bacterium]
MKKHLHHIPNVLTILRIVLVPLFIICGIQNRMVCALAIFVIAALTDTFDGIIARKYNYISNLGKLLDPLADKLLVGFALILFIYLDVIAWWLATIIILREIIMTLYRSYLKKNNIYLSANIYGKIKTTIQMTVIIGALLYEAITYQNNVVALIIKILFYLTAFFSWLSFFIYITKRQENKDEL